MGQGSVELVGVLHWYGPHQHLSGFQFLIARRTPPVTNVTCCKKIIPNGLITSSAAYRVAQMKATACPQPEAFLRGPLSQYQQHCPTKNYKKRDMLGELLCRFPEPDHVASHAQRQQKSTNMEGHAG